MLLNKSRYINPMVDAGFKLIFGQEKHKRLIKELLEHVFEVRITELVYANVERISSVADRNACFDLMCREELHRQGVVLQYVSHHSPGAEGTGLSLDEVLELQAVSAP